MRKFNNTGISKGTADSVKKHLTDFRAGNKEAFDFIALYYIPQLKALAHKLMRSGNEADDVVQNTLILAYRYLSNFRSNSQLSTWLCQILINQTNNYFHKKKRFDILLEDYRVNVLTDQVVADRSAEYESADLCCAVYRMIDELPKDSRIVLILWLRGLKYSEIAYHLGCSIGLIKSRLSRARKRLRKLLEKDDILAAILKNL